MTDLYSLDSYDYALPEELIAQEPPAVRGTSRLMCLLGEEPPLDETFTHIARYLPDNALLVANNSRVIPARLLGTRQGGGRAEALLMTPPPLLEKAAAREGDLACAEAEVLLRPAGKIKIGSRLSFTPFLYMEVLEKHGFGRSAVRLFWEGSLVSALEEVGSVPLPPYIKRPHGPTADDKARYQTIYAAKEQSGSVAAPTAGLHFTDGIRRSITERGCEWKEVTLHVGYGTFSPVRESDIRTHPMHAEYVEITADTAQAVNKAKREGRPVIAVGTTSMRSLEGMAALYAGKILETGILPEAGCAAPTDIFIYPGYEFRAATGLITNFHLPESSLLMLVCAFAGYERTLSAYRHAVENRYRFFSYGDAMLILP
ncbi:MAG: tRNA preQ1(34) S-adenosylmethionine ribosyltransferase-isomerase QueA [Mailhella sp.]|nr:tRNA preQ1(34) S-adenosylmethionine ribosyltransferase-isomerase QueA [Mailhella sp.]